MAWTSTDEEQLRHQLRLTIGATMRLSQVVSLAPYPLSLFQRNRPLGSARVRIVIFLRLLAAIAVSVATVASLLVLYFYYPHLLYLPTVPMFIKILYYISSTVQVVTVGNLLVGCENRRTQYEGYFENVLVLVRQTASQSDCQRTIRYRNTAKAFLLLYCTCVVVLPICYVSILPDLGTIPYLVVQLVPFTVSALILLQYYCVFVHLSSIVRKLNDRLEPLVDGGALAVSGAAGGKHTIGSLLHGATYTLEPFKSETSFQLIEQLRLLHAQATNIASTLSENFSIIIVMIVVAIFASVNIELLELYQSIKNATLPAFTLVLKTLYAGVKFSFYILIAYPNWLMEKENHRTLCLLYKIRRASCSDETNGAIEHYISQISNIQGVHQACGMVNLDMKLISNAVTAITSIMVVLIQFSDAGGT